MSEQQKNDVLVNEDATTSEVEASVLVQAEQAPAQIIPPGAQLASCRTLRGLSIDDVASYLKLAPRQIHAIEADDYASLPGMAITRGFIRTYAKLLGMDAVPLLAALPKQEMRLGAVAGSDRVQPATFNVSSLPLRDRKKIVPIAAVIVVAVAVAVAGFYLWHKTDGGAVSPLSLFSSNMEAAPQTGNVPEVLRQSGDGSSDAPAAVPVAVATVAPESIKAPVTFPKFERLPDAGASVEPPAPAATPVTLDKVVAATVPAELVKPVIQVSNSKDLLRLVLREDAWVEMRRADGSILFSRLLAAGSTESFDVPEPLQLVIGNASGVDATLRGKPVTLPVSKNNVARINLK